MELFQLNCLSSEHFNMLFHSRFNKKTRLINSNGFLYMVNNYTYIFTSPERTYENDDVTLYLTLLLYYFANLSEY